MTTERTQPINSNILKACRGEPVSRVPIWIMRQAGRYLPEFLALRADNDFFTVCRTPELCAEITLQPLRRFDLDAAILFSDILVIPQILGMDVQMVKGVGPVLDDPINTPEKFKERITYEPEMLSRVDYIDDCIAEVLKLLDNKVPLIGFAGAPWTLMCYMIEGKGSKSWPTAQSWLHKHKEEAKELIDLIARVVADFLIKQIRAGVHLVQVFESWGDELSPKNFRKYELPALKYIAETVKRETNNEVPIILFIKGVSYLYEELEDSEYDALSIGWTIAPEEARARSTKTLQGNLDPSVLFDTPENIKEEVHEMISRFGPQKYIANLGHGLWPTHDPDHVGAFVDAVHSYEIQNE
eukprot:TRINITY_DN5811_c0_g1_i1.p1 TRINITY_DN5811_c0_g1~~TRINITY_DN5811_c0_g1_i1.p1  ORF type:complete len:355 (-),score=95.86 TRINITY_DN5811_c0_g1_i1:24-1088(-)